MSDMNKERKVIPSPVKESTQEVRGVRLTRRQALKVFFFVGLGLSLLSACEQAGVILPTSTSTFDSPDSSPAAPDVVAATTTPAPLAEAEATNAPAMPDATSTTVLATPEETAVPAETMTILGTKEQWDHQVMALSIKVPKPSPFEYDNEVTLVHYFATNAAEQEQLNQEVAPGLGTASTYIQADGSLLVIEHSGYTKHQKNPAEPIRKYFEGEDNDVATFPDEDVAYRMSRFLDAELKLSINGSTADYRVAYVQKLAYGAEADKFRQDGNVAVETAIHLDRIKNSGTSVLDNYPGPFIVINFCGWARSDQLDQLRVPIHQWGFNSYNIFLVRK